MHNQTKWKFYWTAWVKRKGKRVTAGCFISVFHRNSQVPLAGFGTRLELLMQWVVQHGSQTVRVWFTKWVFLFKHSPNQSSFSTVYLLCTHSTVNFPCGTLPYCVSCSLLSRKSPPACCHVVSFYHDSPCFLRSCPVEPRSVELRSGRRRPAHPEVVQRIFDCSKHGREAARELLQKCSESLFSVGLRHQFPDPGDLNPSTMSFSTACQRILKTNSSPWILLIAWRCSSL